MKNSLHEKIFSALQWSLHHRWNVLEIVIVIMLSAQVKDHFFSYAENFMEDLRTNLIAPSPPPPMSNVRVILIDREALEGLRRRSPVDRGYLAGVLKRVMAAGPKAIGLDLKLDQFGMDPEGERQLARVLEEARVPIVIAAPDPENGLEADRRDAADFIAQRRNSRLWLAPAVTHLDYDGVVRSFDLAYARQKTFAAALAESSDALAPAERHQAIAWRGEADLTPGEIPVFTSSSLNDESANRLALHGQVVLIGLDCSGHSLELRTPFVGGDPLQSKQMVPEVYVEAHVVDQLLTGRIAPQLGSWGGWGLNALILLIAFFVARRSGHLDKDRDFEVFLLSTAYVAINFLLFKFGGALGGPGLSLPIIAPILLMHSSSSIFRRKMVHSKPQEKKVTVSGGSEPLAEGR